jgi:glycosyltransferase involved in cell wall biosynthesis
MLPLHNKVFLLSRRWSHHASHSGYDILGKHIGTLLSCKPVPDFLLPDRIFWKLTRDMRGYDRTGVALEYLTLRHMALHRDCIYHFIYGENTYNIIGYLNGWRGHRIIATYHKPPKYLSEMVRSFDPIKRLSAIILVGINQFNFFSEIIPKEKIFFLPHPVDTKFFLPPSNFHDREKNEILFVGAHLRDYETLRSIVENAWLIAPQLKFTIVAYPQKICEFHGMVGNYKIVTNISESDLLILYQRSTLLLMPVEDATANNTILEAMSCGLPMVVTDIGAVRDYVKSDFAKLVSPYNSEEMLVAILSLIASKDKLSEMAENARNHSFIFDWEIITKHLIEFYGHLLKIN